MRIVNDGVLESALCLDGNRLVREHRTATQSFQSSVIVDNPSSDPLGDWWKAHMRGRVPTASAPTGRKLRVVDLFCGPGGLALGFRRACEELGHEMTSLAAVDQDV